MSEDQYMSEEREKEPAVPTEMMESEVFTEKMTPVEETTPIEKMIPLEESPAAVREEKSQEQKREIEQAREEPSFRKKKQRRKQTTTYLSQILKQAEKNGGEINKIRTSLESLQKQHRLGAVGQSQSIKQILSQFGQLQKRVTRIQKDIQRIRTGPATKIRKRESATRSRSKKGRSIISTRVRRRTEKK
jgi:hypothetical protein